MTFRHVCPRIHIKKFPINVQKISVILLYILIIISYNKEWKREIIVI